MGIVLFFISIILLILIECISFVVYWINKGNTKGYWLSAAKDVDKFGNHHFRHLFNNWLINKEGYQFGNIDETISCVIGKNRLTNKLTKTGLLIYYILNFIQKNHCENAAKIN